MRTVLPLLLPAPAAPASFTTVDLDRVAAADFLHDLAQRPATDPTQLLVDCSHLACLRTLGVSHVVSQLLVLHQSGARVFLYRVDPVLHRCLQLLRLDALFPVL